MQWSCCVWLVNRKTQFLGSSSCSAGVDKLSGVPLPPLCFMAKLLFLVSVYLLGMVGGLPSEQYLTEELTLPSYSLVSCLTHISAELVVQCNVRNFPQFSSFGFLIQIKIKSNIWSKLC